MIRKLRDIPQALGPGLTRRLGRALRRDEGGATLEFCLWLPFLCALLGSSIEASFIGTRQVMLTGAVDRVVRDLQLGSVVATNHDALKAEICARAGVIPDCTSVLSVELERVDTADFAFRQGNTECVDRSANLEPALTFANGESNDLMLMTVCAAVEPMIPVTGLGLILPKINNGDSYAIVSYGAFVVEPI